MVSLTGACASKGTDEIIAAAATSDETTAGH